MFVYFAQPICGGLIKIGSTKWLKSRLSALQAGSPVEIVMLAAARGTRRHEVRLHDYFAEHRAHGEWFRPAPALLEFISRLPAWHPEIDEESLPRFAFDQRNLYDALYSAGYGQAAIANHFGFSRQRADQLITVARRGRYNRLPPPAAPIGSFIESLSDGSTTDPLEIEFSA